MTDPSAASVQRVGPARAAVIRLTDAVSSERRRVAVILAISLLFWLVVELAANLGFLPLAAAAGLAAFLYTRATVPETLAASAYGTGLLGVGVAVIQLYRGVAGGSTEPLADTVVRLSAWPLVGIGLVALGIWIHRADV